MMAVVERAEREVVVEVGVPGISEGVSGCEGGWGMLMKVGCDMLDLWGGDAGSWLLKERWFAG